MMNRAKQLKTKEFLYGVCYFPEHWDESMWDDDFRRMKEMGMNVVRMGEGAWHIFEPEEGRYSFELFDRALDLCMKHGLKVILGTPTYAPPAWLTAKYPESLRKTFDGKTMHHGSRRHCNYTAEAYLRLCEGIVTAMAEHYKDHPNVIGWQIDNELNCHMDVSFAESDTRAFRKWLQEKYGTLEALNEAWGAAFWAQTYTDWEQVNLPQPTPTYHSPGHLLDFYRFTSDVTIAFAKLQADILRRIAPHQFVTHNGMFGNIDHHKLTEQALDFMSFDSYPAFQLMNKKLPVHFRDRMSGLRLSRVRGMSNKFIILEQQAGPGGQVGGVFSGPGDYLHATPKPGQMRLWVWQSVAHGADSVLFFRWRTCTYGAETLWHGLNHYGNQHHWRLDEAKQLGDELNRLSEKIVGSDCAAEAALLYDYDNDSNCKIERYIGYAQWDQEEAVYQALSERHVITDQLSAQHLADPAKLSRYRVIFYPNAQLLTEQDVAALQVYVENGGTLIVGPRTGYKDRSNRCHMLPFPGVIKPLAGIEVTDFTMTDQEQPSSMVFSRSGVVVSAPVFNEILKPEHPEAEVLAAYKDDYYKGAPAVVRVPVGRGSIVYVGAFFNAANVHALLDELEITDPCQAWADIPKEVEVVVRRSADRTSWLLLNYTSSEQHVSFKKKMREHMQGEELEGTHRIEPYGVRWVELAD